MRIKANPRIVQVLSLCIASTIFLASCAQTSRPGSVGVERKQFMMISAAEVDQLSAIAYADQAQKAKQKNILITSGPQYDRLKTIANRTSLTNLNTPISEFSAILIGPIGQKVERVNGKTTKTYPLSPVKSQSGIRGDCRG